MKNVDQNQNTETEYDDLTSITGAGGFVADVKLERCHQLDALCGVNKRNSVNTFIKEVIEWEPEIPLRSGMEKTCQRISQQYLERKEDQFTPAGMI